MLLAMVTNIGTVVLERNICDLRINVCGFTNKYLWLEAEMLVA